MTLKNFVMHIAKEYGQYFAILYLSSLLAVPYMMTKASQRRTEAIREYVQGNINELMMAENFSLSNQEIFFFCFIVSPSATASGAIGLIWLIEFWKEGKWI